ncbi:MAG TPA: M48 family metalloprotease [Candidatus Sulfotelmatobacter sp.]|nr:M48 family metalloprotease [Candidatus Sulfotelmatobacter sp.]
MTKNKPPLDVRKSLRKALFKSLLIPVLVWAFFVMAPGWLDSRIHSELASEINSKVNLSPVQKEAAVEKYSTVDFGQVSLNCPPGFEDLHARLEKTGIAARFRRLRWGLILSSALLAGLMVASAAIFALNAKAKKSQNDLIACYRLGWTVAMVAALAKVFLLVPLLAYGTFELMVLLMSAYSIKILAIIIIGGLFALFMSAKVLLKKVPMEFKERFCREVTPEEAPELWQAIREAANKLQTAPPDRILIGMKLNFFVTELAVRYDSGCTQGKTLFLCYPLLKQLSGDEVLAIIGHELGHFIGEDTRLTREFYPLRFKIHGTMVALARSGWMGWPSFQFLNFFGLSFGETERATSRARELLADQKAAAVTSPEIAAQALVKFQVAVEAFTRNLSETIKNKEGNFLDIPLQAIVRDTLAADATFWSQLFEKKLPHPLDTHPSLHVRLEALQQTIDADKARSIALAESQSAYATWFSNRDALFSGLAQQAEAQIGKLRARSQVAQADYKTDEGRELLDKHFPEKRWRYKQSQLWVALVFLVLILAGCVVAVIFIDNLIGTLCFAAFAVIVGFVFAMTWKRNRNAEFILTAEGISYTGWNRQLKFTDIEKMLVRRSYSTFTLMFRLKQKQSRFPKFILLKYQAKAVNFSLNSLDAKPVTIAQTVYRYYTRQLEPEKKPAAATNKLRADA